MDDKMIYIPNDDTQNYPFYGLQLVVETQLNESINQRTCEKLYCKLPHRFSGQLNPSGETDIHPATLFNDLICHLTITVSHRIANQSFRTFRYLFWLHTKLDKNPGRKGKDIGLNITLVPKDLY